jgi:hypothetical protein
MERNEKAGRRNGNGLFQGTFEAFISKPKHKKKQISEMIMVLRWR